MAKRETVVEPGFCAYFERQQYPHQVNIPVISRVTDMPATDFDDITFGDDDDDAAARALVETKISAMRASPKQKTVPFKFDMTDDLNRLAREEEKEAAENNARKKKADRRMIQIFDYDKVTAELKKTELGGHDEKKRILHDLRMALTDDGRRLIPDFKHLDKKLVDLASRFPNFVDAIDGLTEDIALAAAGSPERFQVAPILLDGVPGIGKTAFCNALADVLGVPFVKVGAGTLQTSAQLVGTAKHWSNASPGVIFNALAGNKSAVIVLLIDEADKIHNHDSFPVIPALLELIEPESARKFVDQSLMVDLDASRFIIVMTSNNKDRIDTALLSRARVYSIKEPDEAQRRDIANSVHNALRKNTRSKIELDQNAVKRMAEGGGDLRAIARAIRSAFAKALISGKKVSAPAVETKPAKQRIGF